MVHNVRVDPEAQSDSEVDVVVEEPLRVAAAADGYPLGFERSLSFGARAS